MLTIWYRALFQVFLDLRFKPQSQVTARILERPGAWMSSCELDQLIADLRKIACETLPSGELDYGVLSDDPSHLSRSIVTILHDAKTGDPIAFNALAVMDLKLHGKPAEVLHMGLVMVDPNVRSKGFAWVLYGLTCLVLFLRQQMRPLWLSNVTQVPAIVGMVSETFANVYPSPASDAHRSYEHVQLAKGIMANHRHVFGVGADARFDEERFVIENAYTGGSDDLKKTFEEAPKHRDETYNEFCRSVLDYQRGDDVLQLCQLNAEASWRFVMRNVPSRSLPAVLGTLAFVGITRLLLPIVYWFSPERQWGILRPAGTSEPRAS